MPLTRNRGLCQVCTKINLVEYFRGPLNSRVGDSRFVGATPGALRLGFFREVFKRSAWCSFCKLVVQAICTRTLRRSTTPDTILKNDEEMECWLYSYCFGDSDPSNAKSQKAYRIGIASRVGEDERCLPEDHMGDIQLLAQDAADLFGSDLFQGRMINPEKIDVSQLQGWLKRCESDHGTYCTSSRFAENSLGSKPQELLVIDVNRQCICQLPDGSRYLALSYCWPVATPFTLRTENRSELFQPRSLSQKMQELLPTIQDAITLVAEMGERYLWVDSLCIVQNDEDHRKFQISQMDKVYGSAYVTLVSAVTTTDPIQACQGLPSYREHTRSKRQITSFVKGLHLLVPFEAIISVLLNCRWYWRGWAYQELLLSTRIIFFTDVQVYYQCPCGVYCEDGVGEGASPNSRILPTGNIWNPGSPISPDVDGYRFGSLHLRLHHQSHEAFCIDYANKLNEYMTKKLSFATDIPIAFAGVQNVVEKAMGTKFWYGMPEEYLDYFLLWTAMKPREPKDAPLQGRMSRFTTYPSWSWLGWNWEVELGTYYGTAGLRREVAWLLVNRKGEGLFMNSRGIYENSEILHTANKDVNMLGISSTDLPIETRQRHEIDIQGPNWEMPEFLAAWTMVAEFRLDGSIASLDRHGNLWPESENLVISNDRQEWVGSIMMDRLWARKNLSKPQTFDFLLMSRSRNMYLRSYPEVEFFDVEVFENRLWCSINVMLIQREGVIAERIGLGVIHEDAWVAENPRSTFIYLK